MHFKDIAANCVNLLKMGRPLHISIFMLVTVLFLVVGYAGKLSPKTGIHIDSHNTPILKSYVIVYCYAWLVRKFPTNCFSLETMWMRCLLFLASVLLPIFGLLVRRGARLFDSFKLNPNNLDQSQLWYCLNFSHSTFIF